MPIHDWTRVDAGEFHHFHQTWAAGVSAVLNRTVLPPGYQAWVERKADGWEPDVLAITAGTRPGPVTGGTTAGAATAIAPPQARYVIRESDAETYAQKANRVAVRRKGKELVAVIELVSPGNNAGRHAVAAFVRKTTELLTRGIHLVVVDLFPPNPRAPDGIHKVIWDEFREEPFSLPPDKPLLAAAYFAGRPRTAYVEPLAVAAC